MSGNDDDVVDLTVEDDDDEIEILSETIARPVRHSTRQNELIFHSIQQQDPSSFERALQQLYPPGDQELSNNNNGPPQSQLRRSRRQRQQQLNTQGRQPRFSAYFGGREVGARRYGPYDSYQFLQQRRPAPYGPSGNPIMELLNHPLSYPHELLSRMNPDEEAQLHRALYLSTLQNQPHNSLTVEDIEKKPLEPEKTTEGYTRSIDPSLKLVCARCDSELGLEEEDEDRKKGLTESELTLCKRVYFSTCSHVYCGKCVNHFTNRRKVRGEKVKCMAPKCNTSFKGKHKFREIYY